jgi:hypothetical protein
VIGVGQNEIPQKCNYAQFLRTTPASIKGNHIHYRIKKQAKVSKKCANNGIFVLPDAQKINTICVKKSVKKITGEEQANLLFYFNGYFLTQFNLLDISLSALRFLLFE